MDHPRGERMMGGGKVRAGAGETDQTERGDPADADANTSPASAMTANSPNMRNRNHW